VPSIAFADYITEKMKAAVDAGVEAIHVEEPEFWDRAGYSEAFKREYRLYYHEDWQPPHSSADAHHKCAKLKLYLYKRTIDRVSTAIKEYGLTKYDKIVRFYVPTHSLTSYSQIGIVSPEAALTDSPGVDGYIAQIWTNTARVMNDYEGVRAERVFESAYLEYGIMQELVKGTGRRMWFLHDPVEDHGAHGWDDYRMNYLKTVTASLMHPKINTYEIAPWPNRVFDGAYPANSPDQKPIPPEYATILNNVFQTLGDMETGETTFPVRTGLLMSDSAMFQRSYPDCAKMDEETKKLLDYRASHLFPDFFGMAMPLLKYGVLIRPVLLDNVRRFVGYLGDYDVIIVSYEHIKPSYPDENAALANWVRDGGTLIYVGNGEDPYHGVSGFWSDKYPTAAEHLFDLLGIEPDGDKSIFKVGEGTAAVWNAAPSSICSSREMADEWRDFYEEAIRQNGHEWKRANYVTEQRGTYLMAAVFDETDDCTVFEREGLFADMYAPAFDTVRKIRLEPGENGLWFDYGRIEGETLRVIGTGARVFSLEDTGSSVKVRFRGADCVRLNIRLRVPYMVSCSDSRFACT
ncbi:MAG: hypothetical protein IKI93_16905, partial [Clostridia bacterium]|nr:hypothetical protein [Clostridia bacterium]